MNFGQDFNSKDGSKVKLEGVRYEEAASLYFEYVFSLCDGASISESVCASTESSYY